MKNDWKRIFTINFGTFQRSEGRLGSSPYEDISSINSVVPFNEAAWILTDRGAFLHDGATIKRIPDLQLRVLNVLQVKDCYWHQWWRAAFVYNVTSLFGIKTEFMDYTGGGGAQLRKYGYTAT